MKTIVQLMTVVTLCSSSLTQASDSLRRMEIWPEKSGDQLMMVIQETKPEYVNISLCSKHDGSKCRRPMVYQGSEEIPLFVIKSLVKDLRARPQGDISIWDKISGIAGFTSWLYGGFGAGKITSRNTFIERLPPTRTNLVDGFGVPITINNNRVHVSLTDQEVTARFRLRVLSRIGAALTLYEASNLIYHLKQAELYLDAITLSNYSPRQRGISIDFPIEETFQELEESLHAIENNFS